MQDLNEVKIGVLHEDGSVTKPSVDLDEIVEGFFVNRVTICVNEEDNTQHRLCACVINMYEATGEKEFEEKPFLCVIGSIICADDLSEEMKKNIANSCDIDPSEINDYDTYSYGYSTKFEESELQATPDFEEWIKDKMGRIQMLYGFYMDRPQNRIGTVGWDFIKGVI